MRSQSGVKRGVWALALGVGLVALGGCKNAPQPNAPKTGQEANAPAKPEKDQPAQWHYERGLEATKTKETAKAKTAFQTAIALNPTFAPAHEELVRLALAENNDQEAIDRLKAWRLAIPNAPDILARQAEIYLQSQRLIKALQTAREAVKTEPNSALAHNVLGLILERSGDTAGAARELEQASALDPKNVRTRLSLAQMKAMSGKPDDAIALVEPLLKQPELEMQTNYIMGWLLVNYGKNGKPDATAAQPYIEKAHSLEPRAPQLNLARGKMLLLQNKPKEAVPLLAFAVQADTFNPPAMRLLADAFEKLKDSRAAEARQAAVGMEQMQRDLKSARKRYLTNPEEEKNTLQLARMESFLGNNSDAQELLTEVLKRNPDSKEALAILNALVKNKSKANAQAPPQG